MKIGIFARLTAVGVAPSTVYRKVGTVENAVRLIMAREGHRQLERMPELIKGIEGPRIITVFLAETTTSVAGSLTGSERSSTA